MTKFLQTFSALALVCSATTGAFADPVFPESFEVSLDVAGPTVTQSEVQGVFTISISGKAAAKDATITVAVPEGWDGFLKWSDEDFDPGDINPLGATRADDVEWVPVEAMLQGGLKKGNTFQFPVDGDPHMGQLYLYSGDMVDAANHIMVEFQVEEGAVAAEPEFPESFKVTTDPAGLEVTQLPAEDWGGGMIWPYSIMVDGKCDQATAKVTIEVPEGWTGLIGKNTDIAWSSRRKAKAEWVSKQELLDEGYVEGNVIEVEVDGTGHNYTYYLCNGDSYDAANQIDVTIAITRTFPGLVFPKEIYVSLSPEGPAVEQTWQPDGWSDQIISITGTCDAEELTVTLDVPNGWDGFVGATDGDLDESEAQPYGTRAEEDDVQLFFYPLSSLDYSEPPLKKGNTFTFPADGETHYGMAYLYKENMYCMKMINMEVTVNDSGTGISSIKSDGKETRYFNLQGVEVKNPENGIFVKVTDGKVSKINVK